MTFEKTFNFKVYIKYIITLKIHKAYVENNPRGCLS